MTLQRSSSQTTPSGPPPLMLQLGSRGESVEELQRHLVTLHYDVGEVDGIFGQKTLRAVQDFQRANGLVVDGVVGPQTAGALDLDPRPHTPSNPKGNTPAPSTPPPPSDGTEPSWLVLARGELGQKELAGSQHNSRIVEYHASTTLKAKTDETAWCASFVNWCVTKAGFKGTNSAAAASWSTWGVATTARPGAIAVIRNAAAANSSLTTSGNHVGFLLEETATHYKLLGGNQGNQVKVSSFAKKSWSLKAYRWPAGASTPSTKPPAQHSSKPSSTPPPSKGSAQASVPAQGTARSLITKHMSGWSSDESGLAHALFSRGNDGSVVTSAFKQLEDDYNSDSDDVAVVYVNLVKSRSGPALEMLKKNGALRQLLIQILASGMMCADELAAIQYLRGLSGTSTGTGGATTPSSAPSGDKVRSSNITVGGKHFVDWFNQDFQPQNKGKHPTLKLWKKPAEKFGHTIANKQAFAAVFDHCADLWASQLTLNEFLAFFCIIYNETGGTFVPISEKGSMKYMFEPTPGGKASYNKSPNRPAGDQLRQRGVISATDQASWNSQTYPNPQSESLIAQARQCDFWKYRGRGLIQITWHNAYLKHVDPHLVANGYKRCDELSEEELGRIIKTDRRIYLPMVRSYFQASKSILAKVNEASPDWVSIGKRVSGQLPYGQVMQWRCETLLASMRQANVRMS